MEDSANPTIKQEDASEGLRRVLNRHGHGFQYNTLKRCLGLHSPEPLRWFLSVDEYPVELNGQTTHIDFVLAAGTHLLVAECKRVQGWRWGFARSRQSHAATDRPRADFLYWSGDRSRTLFRQARTFGSRHTYHVAVEVKQHRPTEKGDEKGNERGADQPRLLDAAVNQVLKARGGLMQNLVSLGASLRYGGGAIVPVIFTTAELLVTDTDLAESDEHTGKVPETLLAESVDWLWYNSNLSSVLQPSVFRENETNAPTKTSGFQTRLRKDVMRSIAVVRSTGVESFLRQLATDLELTDPV